MFSRCLFCHRPFRANGELPRFPTGRRVAYDPVKGRLWAICESCNRWNLCPVEEREGVLYGLERLARDRGRVLGRTENVSLMTAGDVVLVRVGQAGLAEQAWWRYGRELSRRQRAFESPTSQATAYAFGAMAWLWESVGLSDLDMSITWDDTPIADILRWRRFGWAAWQGRVRCPHCNSVLRALRFDVSWWLYPVFTEDGSISVAVPCPRCDPWTPEKVYRLEGPSAGNVLRRVLAYQHITGASESAVKEAAKAIEEAGSTWEFGREVATSGTSLYRLDPVRSIALEIAVNESVEKEMLQLELQALEFLWKQEEQLARIMDEELTPRAIWERHVRRLPVTVLSRRALAERIPT